VANTVNRKATDFKDYDAKAWYAEAVSAAVDNGLLYGKSSTILDPNGDMTRAEMAAIINRSFGCYKTADISQYKDVSKDKWYYKDVAMAVQMGTYNGRSASSMAPDAPISRQEAMTVVARALELDYDSYSKTDLSAFSDRSEISNWALPYVRAMVGADYIHGRGKVLAPLDNITRAEFAQIFYNIIGTYIVSKETYDKDIKGSVLETMFAVARERLSQHTPEDIAEKAGARYADSSFSLKTLGQAVTVQLPDCAIRPQLSQWHTLTLLHYLDLADGVPLAGRTITFSQYKDGLVRGGGLDRNAELIIRRDLGILPPEELERRCRSLGAEILSSNADFCARFDFAPCYPVWLKVWFADEEFPASGRLLLDESAPHYLTIEDAVTVGSLILDQLTGAQHWAV